MIDYEKFKGIQAQILHANKKNQLVSAGAGSGKTTVMIEKIADLILEQGVDVDNLLVVTFTVLAAQEMKDRLIKKLKEEINAVNEDKKEQILNIIEKINTASIDTIDGFSSKTIKKYFYDLEISPNIEIISDATRDYYLTKAMKMTFNQCLKDGNKINIMLDLFGGNKRNFDGLEDMILSNYNNVINIEDYEKFLDDSCNEYVNSIKSENVINTYICDLANSICVKIMYEYSTYEKVVQDKLNDIMSVLKEFNSKMSFKTNLFVLNKLEDIKFSSKEYQNNSSLNELKLQIDYIYEIKNKLEKNQINENFEEKNEKIIKYFSIFLELLKNFINNYNKIKEKNNLIDFNDLNRLMLKLLKNEKIRNELQNKYTYIFIDEYQDVNPMQDGLMSKLVGENTTVFMVGDVKQSIYGFRGSSPEWFLEKYNTMKQSKTDEDVFDMNVNFRSSPTILEFINEMFTKLMTKGIADIDYKNDCLIEPKRIDIEDEKVKILLVNENTNNDVDTGIYSVKNHAENEHVTTKNKEALLVLKTITELIGTEFYDANLKIKRKLTYSDIAILTRVDKDDSVVSLVELLKENAVPLNLSNKLNVSKSESIKLVLSILKCVAQTGDDVDYLATFLCLSELDIDDIVEIRNKENSFYQNLVDNIENPKIEKGFEIINNIRLATYSRTNKEIISYILNNEKLKYFILRKPNGENELRLLEEFLLKLSPIEDCLGLTEFIEVVESNVSKSGDFDAVDNEDSVTIQTIHKSKGLEYPVVILYNSSRVFSYIGEHKAINFNTDLGLGVDYFDTANRIKTESLTKFAIKLLNNKKGYKEELRLLYVALTRAKNKLFITGTYTDAIFKELKKNSFTNMLLSCFIDNIVDGTYEGENFVVELFDEVEDVSKKNNQTVREVDLIGLDFEYQNKDKFNISVKNSVTGINSAVAQEKGYSSKNVINVSTQYENEDKAQVGTNYHLALEKLDLTKPYAKNTDFELVDYQYIKNAHEKLIRLTEDAINIEKEAEFMMYVPYNEVVKSDITDKVLIQGVVDLIIEKENSVIIVDYKFSKLPAKILKEKYIEQLNLYKKAVEHAYKKPVEHMYIYSILTNELI